MLSKICHELGFRSFSLLGLPALQDQHRVSRQLVQKVRPPSFAPVSESYLALFGVLLSPRDAPQRQAHQVTRFWQIISHRLLLIVRDGLVQQKSGFHRLLFAVARGAREANQCSSLRMSGWQMQYKWQPAFQSQDKCRIICFDTAQFFFSWLCMVFVGFLTVFFEIFLGVFCWSFVA